jgi:hypothetical protein
MNNLKIDNFPGKLNKKEIPKILSDVFSSYGKRLSPEKTKKLIRNSKNPAIKELGKNMSYEHIDKRNLTKAVESFQAENGFEFTPKKLRDFNSAIKSCMSNTSLPKKQPGSALPKKQGEGLLSRIFSKPTYSNKFPLNTPSSNSPVAPIQPTRFVPLQKNNLPNIK